MREPEHDPDKYTGAVFALLIAAIAYMLFCVALRFSPEPNRSAPAVIPSPAEQSRRRPWFPLFPRKEHYEDAARSR